MMNVANIIKKKKEEEARAKEKNNNKEEKQKILDEKIPLWEDYQDENEDFFYVD